MSLLASLSTNLLLSIIEAASSTSFNDILESSAYSSLKGIILETYGSGNAPTNPEFVELLKEAILRGIYIVNVTQCISGSVILGQYETSVQLKEIGIINGNDIITIW